MSDNLDVELEEARKKWVQALALVGKKRIDTALKLHTSIYHMLFNVIDFQSKEIALTTEFFERLSSSRLTEEFLADFKKRKEEIETVTRKATEELVAALKE